MQDNIHQKPNRVAMNSAGVNQKRNNFEIALNSDQSRAQKTKAKTTIKQQLVEENLGRPKPRKQLQRSLKNTRKQGLKQSKTAVNRTSARNTSSKVEPTRQKWSKSNQKGNVSQSTEATLGKLAGSALTRKLRRRHCEQMQELQMARRSACKRC